MLPLHEEEKIGLWICPDKPCSFTLYEDDGISNAYLHDEYRASDYSAVPMKSAVHISATYQGHFVPAETIVFHIQCADIAPVRIFWNGQELPQFLDADHFHIADAGWHYFHSTKICSVKYENGRDLIKMIVDFGKFDLIRMDDE